MPRRFSGEQENRVWVLNSLPETTPPGGGGGTRNARGRAHRAVRTPADPTTTSSCPYPSRLPYCPRWPETPEIIQIMLRPVLRIFAFHVPYTHGETRSTAVPWTRPAFKRARTRLASARGDSSTSGTIGIPAARGRNSSASRRVTLATLLSSFSAHRNPRRRVPWRMNESRSRTSSGSRMEFFRTVAVQRVRGLQLGECALDKSSLIPEFSHIDRTGRPAPPTASATPGSGSKYWRIGMHSTGPRGWVS